MNGATVEFENWHVWVQVTAFTIIFISFLYFSLKTFLMKKEKEDALAAMPLDEDSNQTNQ